VLQKQILFPLKDLLTELLGSHLLQQFFFKMDNYIILKTEKEMDISEKDGDVEIIIPEFTDSDFIAKCEYCENESDCICDICLNNICQEHSPIPHFASLEYCFSFEKQQPIVVCLECEKMKEKFKLKK